MSCRGSRFVPFWSILADVMSQSSLCFSNKKNRESPCGEAGRRFVSSQKQKQKTPRFFLFLLYPGRRAPKEPIFFSPCLGEAGRRFVSPLGSQNQTTKSTQQIKQPKRQNQTQKQTNNKKTNHKPTKTQTNKKQTTENNNTHLTPHALGKPKPIGRS